jgi:hypothetical protein
VHEVGGADADEPVTVVGELVRGFELAGWGFFEGGQPLPGVEDAATTVADDVVPRLAVDVGDSGSDLDPTTTDHIRDGHLRHLSSTT